MSCKLPLFEEPGRLDRTQEAAGSSPASSIKEVPANTLKPRIGAVLRAANLGQNSQ
jgi:hypothetical protein